MIRPLALSVAPLLLLFTLAACGGDPDVVDNETSTKSGDSTKTTDDEPADNTDDVSADKQGSIIESGFGQGDDEYVWVTALVENKSDHTGQTVTVSFNLKDASGKLLKTESQVEGFGWPGQKLAVGTQVSVDTGARVASVDATLLVEDNNTFSPSPPLGTAEGELVKSEYGGIEARFIVKNPTAEPLKDPRIGIICKDKAGKVNGGGSEYPELVPASGEIQVDSSVTLSGVAATCTAYIAGDV